MTDLLLGVSSELGLSGELALSDEHVNALIGIVIGVLAIGTVSLLVRRSRRVMVAVLITLVVTGGAWFGRGLFSTTRGLMP